MGSFEMLVPSEFPMRGAVCLLETPCGSPKEMGFGQEGLSLLYQDHGPHVFRGQLEKLWEGGVG